MKARLVRFSLAALLAALVMSVAQFHSAPADPHASLTLLAGPAMLSPATATGEVVPGQRWAPKKATSPLRVFGTEGLGTLYLASSAQPREGNFIQRLKALPPLAEPASLRFDLKLAPTEIRPLQKKPAPAAPGLKSL